MMEAAEKLTEVQRRQARFDSIASTCWGAFAPVMISDSALIILYATILGAGDMLSMVTTSAQSLANCLLMIPFACLAGRLGYRRTIVITTVMGASMIVLLAAAPWFGSWSRMLLLGSILVFSICMSAYASAWFPLLYGFLLKEERSRYFGVMRFSWQTTSALFCFVCGLVIGKAPPVWLLQAIILITGVGLLGRAYYVGRIPDGHQGRESMDFMSGLGEAISNKPLSGFSVYICFLYLAANSTAPLTFIFIKKSLQVPDNIVVIISSIVLAGMISGFLSAGRIIDRAGIKRMLLFVHFTFAAINISLALIGGNSTAHLCVLSFLLFLFGFCYACSSIAISTEMMSLVSPDNKAISMAYCGSFLAAGTGGSRMLTSLILGSGMLAPFWTLGPFRITHYQTLFLLYGCFILFVCLLLVLVPAVFPKGGYRAIPAP